MEDGKITRIEVIDHTPEGQGRILVKYYHLPVDVIYEIQDEGRTLKVFITEQEMK